MSKKSYSETKESMNGSEVRSLNAEIKKFYKEKGWRATISKFKIGPRDLSPVVNPDGAVKAKSKATAKKSSATAPKKRVTTTKNGVSRKKSAAAPSSDIETYLKKTRAKNGGGYTVSEMLLDHMGM